MEGFPVVEAFFDAFFEAVFGGVVVGFSFGEVGLGDVGAWVVVGVEVVEFFGGGAGGFGDFFAGVGAEVGRDGEGGAVGDVFEGLVDGGVGGVGFGGGGEVDGGVGEGDAGLGHADEVDGVEGVGGDVEGVGVGEADVFGGGDDEAAGDEAWVFSGVEHFGEPVEGGVGVGAADGFDEGGDGVVVGVAVAVVDDGFFLD